MLDSGSNTSFISKNVVKKLGIRSPKTHLTMNFAEGQKKSDTSEFLYATVVSNTQTTYSEIFASLCNKKNYAGQLEQSRERHQKAIPTLNLFQSNCIYRTKQLIS